MRETIKLNLASFLPEDVVESILLSYEDMVSRYQKGDIDGCLSTASGKFVENILRAILFLSTGSTPKEIKSVSQCLDNIKNDKTLSDSLRLLIPQIAYHSIYEMRSKRGALHVKEINPRNIDASLSIHSASWIMAELLRIYHSDSEEEITKSMTILMRGNSPIIEKFGDHEIVTTDLGCDLELLLLISKAEPHGISRKDLGKRCQYAAPDITKCLSKLKDKKNRFVYEMEGKIFRITSVGESLLKNSLTSLGIGQL